MTNSRQLSLLSDPESEFTAEGMKYAEEYKWLNKKERIK